MSPAEVVCANCGRRPGTERWVGEGGVMALVHGHYAMWCEQCCVEAQLDYARKRAAAIPELEARLATLRDTEADGDP